MKSGKASAMIVVMGLLLCMSSWAEEMNESQLAQKAQNPVSDLISLPFQNNMNFNVGPQDKTQNILNIQPVYYNLDKAVTGGDWTLRLQVQALLPKAMFSGGT